MRSGGIVALLVFVAVSAGAEDEPAGDDLDAILEGFEETPILAEDELPSAAEPGADAGARWWELTGSLRLETSYNYRDHRSTSGTDYEGLQRLRTKLNLRLDVDLPPEIPGSWLLRVEGYGFYDLAYRANGRGEYTSPVLNTYEVDYDFQEVYLQGTPLPKLDLKLGRQIISWGRSDTLRVLDVLNPLDLREPGLVDVVDLRRPVTAARVDYYRGDWSLSGVVIPEIRFDEAPVYGSDFFPAPFPIPNDTPRQFGADPEYGFALTGIKSGWDVSFHVARFHSDTGHVDPSGVLLRERQTLVGAGGNLASGNWIAKGELAWIEGVEYFRSGEKSRIDVLGGLEYYGFEDTTLALEIANRHILDFDGALRAAPDFAQRNRLETSIRYTGDFLNARLHLTALALVFGERAQDGSILRFSAAWDLRDALTVTGGILLFQKGDGDAFPLASFARNDRLFLELEWSF